MGIGVEVKARHVGNIRLGEELSCGGLAMTKLMKMGVKFIYFKKHVGMYVQ